MKICFRLKDEQGLFLASDCLALLFLANRYIPVVLKEGAPHHQQQDLATFVRNAESGVHPDLLIQKL